MSIIVVNRDVNFSSLRYGCAKQATIAWAFYVDEPSEWSGPVDTYRVYPSEIR